MSLIPLAGAQSRGYVLFHFFFSILLKRSGFSERPLLVLGTHVIAGVGVGVVVRERDGVLLGEIFLDVLSVQAHNRN